MDIMEESQRIELMECPEAAAAAAETSLKVKKKSQVFGPLFGRWIAANPQKNIVDLFQKGGRFQRPTFLPHRNYWPHPSADKISLNSNRFKPKTLPEKLTQFRTSPELDGKNGSATKMSCLIGNGMTKTMKW